MGNGERSTLVTITAMLAVVALVHAWLLDPLHDSRLLTVGGLAECAIWLLLYGVLVGVQLRPPPRRIQALLSVGLAIWLVSQTADLMDEFLRQPLWISTYGEDIARVVGMLITALGLLGLIRHSASTMGELERLSYRDSLTGLNNRRRFQISTNARAEQAYSLLLMDLDHFKAVNDEYGHDTGDSVLRDVAELLTRRFSSQGEIFRLGGEEFAVLMEAKDEAGLLEVAEQVRHAVGSYRSATGASMTVSIGAGTRTAEELPGHLMRRVDRALYRAKDAGRDRVVLAA